jgi:hypothetical protein
MEIFEAYNDFAFIDDIGIVAGTAKKAVDKGSLWKLLGSNDNYIFVECIKSKFKDNFGVQFGLEVNTFNKHFTKIKS